MARRPTKQQREALRLAAKLEPSIRAAFIDAIRKARNAVDFAQLVEALEARNVERAIRLLRIEQGVLFPLDDAIRAAFVAGGQAVSAPAGLTGAFGFDGRHPRAETWAATHGSSLIQGIQQDTLTAAREVIGEGLAESRSPRKIATDLVGRKVGARREGGFIGLTDQQTDSVARARAALQAGDLDGMRAYLRLRQRDRRFDAIVKKAIKERRAVLRRDVERIAQAHTTKALGYRGRVIANNEAFTAAAAGRHEAHLQLLDRPGVADVTIRWQHNLSEDPRLEHQAMDGTVISIRERFQFSDVAMAHPHDPAGGAKHSIGCRCVGVYRVELEKG